MELEAELWIKRYNLNVRRVSDLSESIQIAIKEVCYSRLFAVCDGNSAISLICSSKRSYLDLKEGLDNSDISGNTGFPIDFIFREWQNLPTQFEICGFVCKRKLTALCQYFYKAYFPDIPLETWKLIKNNILNFFNEKVRCLPYECCVIDFVAITPSDIRIIEINPWGTSTGGALFSWVNDETLLHEGPFQFRILSDNVNYIVI